MKILFFLATFLAGLSHMAFAAADSYQYFENNGVRIAYRSFGEGSPLFLLNGGPGRSSDTFTELAENLQTRTGRQVILFDQRGTGRSRLSEANEGNVTLDLMVEDLEALRVHLGFAQISILGHSFGGMYAMTYASKYPQNVASLILSCSGGVDLSWQEYTHHNMLSRLTPEARERYAFWTSAEQEALDPIRSTLEALRLLVPAYIYHQEFVPQLEQSLVNLNYYTPAINNLVWRSMGNYDLSAALAVYRGPTLILAGRQDILGEQVPIKIQQAISGSRLEFLDECSHYPWLDSPQAYFSRITDFLNNR